MTSTTIEYGPLTWTTTNARRYHVYADGRKVGYVETRKASMGHAQGHVVTGWGFRWLNADTGKLSQNLLGAFPTRLAAALEAARMCVESQVETTSPTSRK